MFLFSGHRFSMTNKLSILNFIPVVFRRFFLLNTNCIFTIGKSNDDISWVVTSIHTNPMNGSKGTSNEFNIFKSKGSSSF